MILIQGRPELVSLALNSFVIATLIAFIRYVIGIKHWRNYSAITLALSAYLFASAFLKAATGLVIWGYFFVIILIFATMTYKLLNGVDMHYFARLGLIYMSGAIGLLLGTFLLSKFTEFNPLKYNFPTLGLILMLLPLDDITLLRMRKSTIEYFRRIFGTVIISLSAAGILLWERWNLYLYTHQGIVLIFTLILIIISQWRSINLSDYLRFREIAKHNLDKQNE